MTLTARRLLFLALVCLLVVPTAVMAQEDLTESYVSPDGFVEFQYPAGWTIIEDSEFGGALAVTNSATRTDLEAPPGPEEIVVAIIPVASQFPDFPILEPGASPSENAEILVDDFLAGVGEDEANVTPTEALQIGPYSAAKVTAYDTVSELGFMFVVIDAETHVTIFLGVSGSETLLATSEPTVLAIAETFVFSGDPSPTGRLSTIGMIGYGETVTGDLQNPDGDGWSFTGNAGDVVTIALNSDDFDAYVELFDPAGNLVASDDDSGGSLNSLIDGFTLPASGEFIINARGWSSSARGAYTLTLSSGSGQVEPPTVTVAGAISYGQTVNGDLQVDDGDRWTFMGNAGDVVTVALNSDNFDTFLELYGPDGTLLVSDDDGGGSLNSLIDGFTLPANGTYSINARGFSSTARGMYTLELTSGGGQIAPPPVTGSGTISYGQTVNGDLQVDEGDRWTFMGNAGDVVTVALNSDAFDTFLELYGPDGALLVSDDDGGDGFNSRIDAFTLPANGTYSINARGFSSTARGAYTLALTSGGGQIVPPPVQAPGSINYDETVTGDLQVDDGDRWSFTGNAGDIVTIALTSDDFDTFLELYGPDGALLVSDDDGGDGFNSLISEFTLPANGTYSINARGFSSTARGVYTLTLSSGIGGQVVPPPVTGAGSISYGQTVNGDLQNDEGDRWTFTGNAGDIVTIALDSDDFDAYLELFDAADSFLTSDDDSGGSLNSLITGYALPANGTYTILARGFGSSARGAYTLSLSLFDTTELDEPGMIAYGDMVQALLSNDDGDRWTFAGAQGDIISIALNSDAFDAFVELLDADGNVIASDDDSGGSLNSLISGFTLPAKADYTIVARPLGTGSGLYTLELSQVDPSLLESAGVLEQGVLMYGNATTIGQRWTYNGTAGERISVLVGGETDIYLELLGPDGVALFDTQDSYNWGHALFDNAELPVSGEYTLIVRARRAEEWSDGGYALIVGRPPASQG